MGIPLEEVIDQEEKRMKGNENDENAEARYQQNQEKEDEEEEWGILQTQVEMGLRNKEVESWRDRVVVDSGILNQG